MVLSLLAGIVNYIVISPILFTFFAVVLSVSSLGKAFGLRRLYVNFLLRIFEYGRVNIERVKVQNSDNEEEDSLIEHESDEDPAEPEKKDDVILTNGDAAQVKTADLQSNGKPKGENGHVRNGSANGHAKNGNGISLISKSAIKLAPDMSDHQKSNRNTDQELTTESFDFKLENCLDYMNAGMEAIIEDDVTSRFEAEEIKNWNLLTRTNRRYEFITWRLTVIWVIGFFIRYFILMPIRVFICFLGVLYLTMCTALVGCLPDNDWKPLFVQGVLIHCCGVLSSALSPVVTYHNAENKPKKGICVANHTSPIDALVLMCDNCYSLIGQSHGGFLGVLQKALSRASPHIWFERAEAKDRHAVAGRLKEHVSNPKNPPILIFPEGTCINNTSVMQFKKGSFEVGGVIYPVAIKYDARFGDAFWNSAKYSMMQHLFLMMTSWAIVCDVWYLPPMYQQEGETAIAFANRVKSVIAKQGGLVDLMWDGQLKRQKARKEWKEQQQEEFTKRLKGE